jgi:hypothetical protein
MQRVLQPANAVSAALQPAGRSMTLEVLLLLLLC